MMDADNLCCSQLWGFVFAFATSMSPWGDLVKVSPDPKNLGSNEGAGPLLGGLKGLMSALLIYAF